MYVSFVLWDSDSMGGQGQWNASFWIGNSVSGACLQLLLQFLDTKFTGFLCSPQAHTHSSPNPKNIRFTSSFRRLCKSARSGLRFTNSAVTATSWFIKAILPQDPFPSWLSFFRKHPDECDPLGFYAPRIWSVMLPRHLLFRVRSACLPLTLLALDNHIHSALIFELYKPYFRPCSAVLRLYHPHFPLATVCL